MSHNILSIESAARFLHCSEKELKQLATGGEIPYFEQGERLVFEQSELDNWLSGHFISDQNARRQKHHKIPLDTSVVISSFLRPEGLALDLPGHSVAAVLKNLTGVAEKTGLLYDPEEFYQELRLREELSSTAMNNGVALVHPCHRNDFLIEAPFICICRSENPIFFGSPDGVKTDLFFLIACQESTLHLQILAGICQLLAVTRLTDDLRAAETPGEMREALLKAEKTKDSLLQKHPGKAGL